jgi:hypothetical protein
MRTIINCPPPPEGEFEEHRHEYDARRDEYEARRHEHDARRHANRGIYTLTATQAPELIMNDMFDPPQPVLLPYPSFFNTLAPLQIREEEDLGIHLPSTDQSSEDEEQFIDYSSEDEEQINSQYFASTPRNYNSALQTGTE